MAAACKVWDRKTENKVRYVHAGKQLGNYEVDERSKSGYWNLYFNNARTHGRTHARDVLQYALFSRKIAGLSVCPWSGGASSHFDCEKPRPLKEFS